MPSKKKKYNARFPAGRIKKIMQTDEDVGKVAQAVPVIISRTLELFVESLLTKSMQITLSRNAKTLTPSHMKQCILSESRFDFLKDLVKNVPDASTQEDNDNDALFDAAAAHSDSQQQQQQEQSTSAARAPVIQYGPKLVLSRANSTEKMGMDTPSTTSQMPALIPLVQHHTQQQSHSDGPLSIDEDYDN